jgi:hypothetical protein
MGIPFGQNFDQMEFFEFLWLYERLAKEKEKEAKNINTNRSLGNGQKDLAQEMLQKEGLV